MHSRALGRRRRGRYDHSRREHERERALVGPRPENCGSERDRGSGNRDPSEATEPGEKATEIRQVCGCNEGQRCSR